MFKYQLGQTVKLALSDEQGVIRSRAEHVTGEPHYYLLYKAADGRQVEAWWIESALEYLPVEDDDFPF